MDDFESIITRPSTARNAPSLDGHFVARAIIYIAAATEHARFLGRHAEADSYLDIRDYLAGILRRSLRNEAAEGRGR